MTPTYFASFAEIKITTPKIINMIGLPPINSSCTRIKIEQIKELDVSLIPTMFNISMILIIKNALKKILNPLDRL